MKVNIKAFIAVLLMAVAALPMAAQGQIKITTKKEKISDFTAKTTKVVLSGNEMADQFLKDAMSSCWRVSPYEFCTKDEQDAIREVYPQKISEAEPKTYGGTK